MPIPITLTATATIIAELAIILALAWLASWALKQAIWFGRQSRANAADATKWRNARDRRKAGRTQAHSTIKAHTTARLQAGE